MKLNKWTLTVAGILAGVILTSGCYSTSQTLEKSTVFGFQAKTPGTQNSSITVQFGLVRNEYWSNPTSTNKIFAAQYSSHVDTKLSALSQSAKEDFSTITQSIDDNETSSNTSIKVITQ